MTSTSLHYDRIKQIVDFFVSPKLTAQQNSLLISNLLSYEKLTGLRLIDAGDTSLTVFEEDVQIIHTSSVLALSNLSEQKTGGQTGLERMVGSPLEAQSSSVLKILREDLGILHTTDAGPDRESGADKDAQLNSRDQPISSFRQTRPRPWSLPIDSTGHSRPPGAKVGNEPRVMLNQGAPFTVSLNQGNLVDAAPVAGYMPYLAYAPPLSEPAAQKQSPNKKRSVAVDFFPSNITTETGSTQPPRRDAYSVDQLIEEEKARFRQVKQAIAAGRVNSTNQTATIDLTQELASPKVEHIVSSIDIPQPAENPKNKTVAAQDTSVCIDSTSRAPDTKPETAATSRKRKRDRTRDLSVAGAYKRANNLIYLQHHHLGR
ncbi:MAG: hypothetical protein Q9168_003158 [Polycauliona sp. 1 TL-2023]